MRSDSTSNGSIGVYGASASRCGRRKAAAPVGPASSAAGATFVAAAALFWVLSAPEVASIRQLREVIALTEGRQGAEACGCTRGGPGQRSSIATAAGGLCLRSLCWLLRTGSGRWLESEEQAGERTVCRLDVSVVKQSWS